MSEIIATETTDRAGNRRVEVVCQHGHSYHLATSDLHRAAEDHAAATDCDCTDLVYLVDPIEQDG